jgi:NADH dehydrogenase [ubiquinone] 1 alpha subcomplex assembly factor 1
MPAIKEEKTLIDFGHPDAVIQWFASDDVVMGGVSNSGLQATAASTALFAGVVSLENNGGFASIRCRPAHYDLRGYDGIALRVKGDGKRYGMNLEVKPAFNGVLYRASFDTGAETWSTIYLPFGEFMPMYRGMKLRAVPIDLGNIVSLGLIITNKQSGPFALEIASINVYQAEE